MDQLSTKLKALMTFILYKMVCDYILNRRGYFFITQSYHPVHLTSHSFKQLVFDYSERGFECQVDFNLNRTDATKSLKSRNQQRGSKRSMVCSFPNLWCSLSKSLFTCILSRKKYNLQHKPRLTAIFLFPA